MSNLSHMRSIGVGTYTTNQKIVDGEVKDDTIETNRQEHPIAVAFKKEWEDNWHPMIGEQSTGVMTFLKKLDDFLN